jgi:hypothetical protein
MTMLLAATLDSDDAPIIRDNDHKKGMHLAAHPWQLYVTVKHRRDKRRLSG